MPNPPLSRRRFLGWGAAGAGTLVLSACGDDGSSTGATTTAPSEAEGAGYALFQFIGGDKVFAAGSENRLPFGVGDKVALLPLERTPESLSVQLVGPDDAEVGAPIEVARHAEGLPRAYYPLHFTVDEPGAYTARAEVEGEPAEMSFQVAAPDEVALIGAGDRLPPLETPTTTDARGVTPICTRDPICPLHERTLAEALTTGRPVVLLVATPAFCQVAVCGPVLDVLLDTADPYADRLTLVHAEVYKDPETSVQGADAFAPVVRDLGLQFEPVLFLAGADGTIAQRLDSIYDHTELDRALDALASG